MKRCHIVSEQREGVTIGEEKMSKNCSYNFQINNNN